MEEPVNKVALSFSLNFVVLTISLQKMRRSQGAKNSFKLSEWENHPIYKKRIKDDLKRKPPMPFHRAVDPGVEDDQPEQGQECREEEVHVLLVDLGVGRSLWKETEKKKTIFTFYLGIHWVVGKSHIEFPVPGYLQHFGEIVHSAAIIIRLHQIIIRLYTVLRLSSWCYIISIWYEMIWYQVKMTGIR